MKKQIIQTTGNTDQPGDQKDIAAAIGAAFSERFFFIQIRDGGIDHRLAQGKD
jgi:hypothetical protein